MRLTDECSGDSSVSASPPGPRWRLCRSRFPLDSSNSLPSQPLFTPLLFYLFAEHQDTRKGKSLSPELETVPESDSVLSVLQGKCCAHSRRKSWT